MSKTDQRSTGQQLTGSLKQAIATADEPVQVEHVVVGGEAMPPTAPSAPDNASSQPSGAADDIPVLEPSAVDDLLDYASDEVGVLVLTRDDQLYDIVQGAVGDDYPVLYAHTRTEALEAVMAGDCGILITEARNSPAEVEALSAELREYLPSLVTIVAGRREDGDALMHLLSSGHVHRFLLKPISPGQTRLLVESSIRRHLELRENPELLAPVPMEEPAPAREINVKTLLGIGVAVGLVIVGLVAWLLSGDDADLDSPAGVTPSVATERATAPGPDAERAGALDDSASLAQRAPQEPALAPEVRDLLSSGQSAFMEGRLAEPAGDNALDYYRAVLGMDPNNNQAAEGVAAILEVLFNQAERALVEERLADAAALIDQIREIEPGHPRLSFLDVQWSRERQRIAGAQAAAAASAVAGPKAENGATPPAVAQKPAPVRSNTQDSQPENVSSREPRRSSNELTQLLSVARERLQAGVLVRGDESAKASLLAARERYSENTEVQALWQALGDQVLARAEGALQAGNLDQAEDWLTAARDLDLSGAQMARVENAIAAVEQAQAQARQAELLAQGLERLEQGQLTTPAGRSAADYLGQLRDLNPSFPGLEDGVTALSRAFLGNANEAARDGNWGGAKEWVDQAERLGVNEDRVQVTRERVRIGARQSELMAEVIPATQLTLVSAKAPNYPRSAVRREQEGAVALEFTVARDGTTSAITVVGAEPEGVFEEAAIEALERYVFEPYQEDGRVYERRARVRVRFALE